MKAERLLQIAGVVGWLAVGLPAYLASSRPIVWFACWGAWLVGFVAFTENAGGARPRAFVALALQSAAAALMSVVGRGGPEVTLLVAVAGQLPFAMALPGALAWTAAQTATLSVIDGGPLAQEAARLVSLATFQLFAVGAAYVAVREASAREELSRVNAELIATRELLAETSRTGERLRIARDLHDTLGHQLTALNLNLEVAAHASGEAVAEHVQRAQGLGRMLLAEVRDVVAEVRDERPLDLAPALRALAAGAAPLRVHLDLQPELVLRDAAQAEVVFRWAQEVVTNAVRHASARNLWISIARSPTGLVLQGRDDGRGASSWRAGNGLTGMRERIEGAGGSLEVHPGLGRGFALEARL